MKSLHFILPLLLFACTPRALVTLEATKGPTPNFAQFVALEAVDLFEDMGPAATNNDEIALFVHVLENQGKDNWRVLHNSSDGPYPFVKGDKIPLQIPPLDLKAEAKENSYLVLTLLELDRKKQHRYDLKPREETITKQLLRGRFDDDRHERYRIAAWLQGDEVLDVQSFNLSELEQNPAWTVNFKGIDLFDAYEYKMSAQLY